MRATSIGHAGMLIETASGSILCDPWFVPAFFGSWFVFPRNDQLGDQLLARIESADFLYLTHLHADHHDEPFGDHAKSSWRTLPSPPMAMGRPRRSWMVVSGLMPRR